MKPHREQDVVCRLDRRNSSVEIVMDITGRRIVTKHYHAKYSALDEAEAYHRLDQILEKEKMKGLRTARVISVNQYTNSICTEYVPGETLSSAIVCWESIDLDLYKEPLIRLLAFAKLEKQKFDCDPTNIICRKGSGELVIIDPLCEDMDLNDYTAVVFFWGLVKSYVKLCNKPWHWPRLLRIWYRLYSEYLYRTGGNDRDFNAQIYQYINRVIKWNIRESEMETFAKRWFRKLLLVPLWKTISLLFRWNIVRV